MVNRIKGIAASAGAQIYRSNQRSRSRQQPLAGALHKMREHLVEERINQERSKRIGSKLNESDVLDFVKFGLLKQYPYDCDIDVACESIESVLDSSYQKDALKTILNKMIAIEFPERDADLALKILANNFDKHKYDINAAVRSHGHKLRAQFDKASTGDLEKYRNLIVKISKFLKARPLERPRYPMSFNYGIPKDFMEKLKASAEFNNKVKTRVLNFVNFAMQNSYGLTNINFKNFDEVFESPAVFFTLQLLVDGVAKTRPSSTACLDVICRQFDRNPKRQGIIISAVRPLIKELEAKAEAGTADIDEEKLSRLTDIAKHLITKFEKAEAYKALFADYERVGPALTGGYYYRKK